MPVIKSLPAFISAEKLQDSINATKTSHFNWHKLLSSKCEELVSADSSKYETIKSQLLREGKLYEDEDFFSEDYFGNVTCCRPKEICGDPQFYVDGCSRFDVNQGGIGDCWVLASLADLSMNKKLFSQVVPEGQSFDDGDYVGMFRFRFWRFGEWVEIIIDDRLPIEKDEKQLMNSHSTANNEFWCPLLEKAYAKFRGMNYKAIDGGVPSYAMQNFTGGITMTYFTADIPKDLGDLGFYTILLNAYERKALIVCATENNKPELNNLGLIESHAYSVNKVMNLTTDKSVEHLLRIRNPWGNEKEWNGAWSDKSNKWNCIPEDKRKEMDLVIRADGEFWMCYEDFKKYFEYVQLCYVSSDSPDPAYQLKMASMKGKWIKGLTAGGRKDLESFYCNPQYKFTLPEADTGNTENKCEVLVDLSQKDGADNIAFKIIKLANSGQDAKPFELESVQYPVELDATASTRLTLDPGVYIIIPSTEEPDQEDEFLLRIISQKNIQITEYDGDLQFSAPPVKVGTFLDKGLTRRLSQFYADNDTVDVNDVQFWFSFAFQHEMGGQPISKELSNKVMAYAVLNPTAELSFDEFKNLWTHLRRWQAAFSICSKDNTMPRRKLRAALQTVGWTVNVKILQQLYNSFYFKKDNISFVDFINCILGVRYLYNKRQHVQAAGAKKKTPKVENEPVEK